MANLYLIRKQLESYSGPWALGELREQYKQMEFGLQDEVAGNCGKWLTFDNVPALRRQYPELAKLVQEEFLNGWGVSESSIKLEARPSRSLPPRRKTNFGLGFSIMLVIIVLAVAALFIATGGRFDSKFFENSDFPEFETVRKSVEYRDFTEFERVMDELMPRLLPKVIRSRKAYNDWIPYLRLLAFRRDGTIPTLKPKLLRGMGSFVAPLDCSIEAWRQRWLEGKDQWDSFLTGQSLGDTEWARVLMWDPHWIKRRNRVIGWQIPSNYYEGCLIMAHKALEDLRLRKSPILPPPTFYSRIQAQVALIQGQSVQNDKSGTFLTYMTCIDSSNNKAGLDLCAQSYRGDKELPVERLLDQSRLRNEIRIFLGNNSTFLTDDNLVTLSKLHRQLKQADDFTGLSYQPEIKFLVAVMLNQGSLKEAAKRMRYEFPEVNFDQ